MPLLNAARNRHEAIVKLLGTGKVDVNLRDTQG
jgi:hypothetical protein